ncbi:LysR family transcriptional regulator [Ensifer sp. Root127]|uniref:LysR family transcriptional regulator n=1 Tax=Ensifer sp. Root127 TaxID=1736440 RepID=UPI00138EC94C|nr:LysR family transcriptional regulator [Ensifer sp. Root127]
MSAPKYPTVLPVENLRTFVSVVDEHSFVAGACVVGRSPTAVSVQIKKLESLLRTTLIDRTSRSLTLTTAGRRLLVYARQLLDLSNETVAVMREPHFCRSIKVGIPWDVDEYRTSRIVRRVASRHPGIAIEVVSDSVLNLLGRFDRGELEISVVVSSGNGNGRGTVIGVDRPVWAGGLFGRAFERDPLPIAVPPDSVGWHVDALAELERVGRRFRIAYASASPNVRRAAVIADVAVAPMFRSFMADEMVVLDEQHRFPQLQELEIRLVALDDLDEVGAVVVGALRQEFDGTFTPKQSSGARQTALSVTAQSDLPRPCWAAKGN